MKVALVLATSAGGVGRHVRSVAAGLTARGATVVVLGPEPTERLFDFSGAGARFVAVDIADRPHPLADVRAVARLRKLTAGADVVHAHGLRAGGLAVLARRRPLVVTLHNAVLAGGMIGTAYAVLERLVARGATEVLAVSPDLADRMRELGARSVTHALVPAPPHRASEGVDAQARLRVELGVENRPLIVAVGRLADQKGVPTLLGAAASWAGRDPAPLVAIAGDGPLEDMLRTRIERDGLPVRLLGRRTDVPELLAAADVAVVPSVWEGQPLNVQEMLRAGRPLVASRVGGIPLMVGDAALLVPAGDAMALAAAVTSVLDDPALAKRLAEAAAAQGARLPTEQDAVDQLAGLYESL